MANAFYLQNLVNQKGKSSIVEISTFTGGDVNCLSFTIYGLLSGSIKASYKNKWEAAMPSLDTLSQVSQLLDSNSGNVISWLNGTSAAWGATDPVRISMDFYKFTLNSSDNIRAEVGKLASLASLSGNTSGNELANEFKVRVHNGYRNDFWEANNTIMGLQTQYSPDKDKENKMSAEKWGASANLSQNIGTVTIKASGMKYSNMLLEQIDIEPSRQMVAPNKPLFIKVNATFRGVRACITKDINECFGLNISDTGENFPSSGGKDDDKITSNSFGDAKTNARLMQIGAYWHSLSREEMDKERRTWKNGIISDSTIQNAIEFNKKNPEATQGMYIDNRMFGERQIKKVSPLLDSTYLILQDDSVQAINKYGSK